MKMGYIITQEEVYKERFNANSNNLNVDINDIENFLSYFLIILGLAVQSEIIDESRRDKIFEYLFGAFESDTDSNSILVTNKMYVFSAWLMTFSKWEAWIMLEKIADFNSACLLYNEADKWYKQIIREMTFSFGSIEKSIETLDNSNLRADYKCMGTLLKNMKNYSVIPDISFKNEHISRSQSVFLYCFIKEKNGNIIQSLRNAFHDFAMELRIFNKLNGKKFAEFSLSDYTDSEKQKAIAEVELNQKFESQIRAIKAEREKALDKAIRFNMKYENMSAKEQATVPSEIVVANDTISIENKYSVMISEINNNWSKAEGSLDDMFSKANELEGQLILQDIPTLSFLLQEIALISIYRRGIINYPDSRLKKGMILSRIGTSFAINELLNYVEDYQLSEKEREFLQSAVSKNDFAIELEEIKSFSAEIADLNFFGLFEFAKEKGFFGT